MAPIATPIHNDSVTRTHKIAVIPGDGIGPETVSAGMDKPCTIWAPTNYCSSGDLGDSPADAQDF